MKWMKGYLAGILTALLLCGLVVTAGAKSGKVMQELTYRDIRVSLDGEVLDLRNAIGEPVEPFMFDGTNYLPVRALAEALGLNVAWDGAEVMVVLTTPTPEPSTPEPEPETVILPQTTESASKPEAVTVPQTTESTSEPEADAFKEPETQAVSVANTQTETVPVTDTTEAEVIEPETVKKTESPNAADFGDCRVEIKKARLARNYDDTLSIVVTIQWTNNGNYAKSSLTAINVKALQKGEELLNGYPDDFDSGLYLKSIAPGETLEVEEAFKLTDNRNRVEIVVTDYYGKSENSAKMTFRPSDLKQPASVKKTETTAPTVTNSRTVYVTPTGKHYHYSSTCNGGHYSRSTLSEALARGLTPCDKCVLTGN